MAFGNGLLLAPFLSSKLGFLASVGFLFLALIVNFFSFNCIIEANTFTGHKDFKDLVDYLTPSYISKAFSVTFGLDMEANLTANAAVCWNIFLFIMNEFGLIEDS